jgi:predicted MFS family arabinose efflux permease
MTAVIHARGSACDRRAVIGRGPSGTSLRAELPLLVASFTILFFVIGGGVETVGVLLNAISSAEGWSRASLSAGISVGALGAGLFAPVVGVLIDRFGVRAPMTLGAVLLAAGFGVLASMSQPWHFVAANALLGPGFAASAMLPITVSVTTRLPGRAAFALGLVGVGSSVGAFVLAPTLQHLIDAVGWRGTYVVMGAYVVLTPIPFLLWALPRGRLIRPGDSAAPPKVALDLRQELRRPGLFALAGVIILAGLVGFGVNVHLVPLLTDLAHGASFAAAALGAAIGLSAAGKVAGGWIGDRIGALATLRLALAIKLAALALLPLASSRPVVAGFVGAWGLATGAQIAVVPVVALAVLGTSRFATLFGLLQLAATLAIGLAPIAPGLLSDWTGSYALAVVFWFAALAGALGVALRLRMPEAAPAVEPQALVEDALPSTPAPHSLA